MLQYVGNQDRMTVELGSNYTAGDGSIVLASGHGARLPAVGTFWIRPKTGTYQSFKVTARSTDTLTVVSAQDGTTDLNMTAGVELEWTLTASGLSQLKIDCDPTRLLPPFPSQDGWVNQDNTVLTESDGNVYLFCSSSLGTSCRMRYINYTAPMSFTTYVEYRGSSANYGSAYIGLKNSGDAKFYAYGPGNDIGAGGISRFASYANYASGITGQAFRGIGFYLKIEDNNTNVIFSLSPDNIWWNVQATVARTEYLTSPNQFVIGIYCGQNLGNLGVFKGLLVV